MGRNPTPGRDRKALGPGHHAAFELFTTYGDRGFGNVSTASRPRPSLLDPYIDQIQALLAKYPNLSAVRIREEIARGPNGYTGSTIILRRYLRTVRPARGRVYQEVHYEPGQAMQIDWGECGCVQVGSTTRKVSVFVAVLCYSRLTFIEFTLSQRKAEFYRSLVNALTFFGGSAQRLGTQRLFPSRVPGPVWLFLHATGPLCTARPGIQRHRRSRRPLRQAQCSRRTDRRTASLPGLPGPGAPLARRSGQCAPA